MKLVDKSRLKVLPNRGRSAADANVLITGRRSGFFESGLNAVGDEIKGRTALHLNRFAVVVSQDKCWNVIRRLVTPPALPTVIGPRPANRPEHIAAEYPCALIGHTFFGKAVINAGLAAFLTMHFAKDARIEKPFHQLGASSAKRILQVLIRTRGKAIQRDGKTLHYDFWHRI